MCTYVYSLASLNVCLFPAAAENKMYLENPVTLKVLLGLELGLGLGFITICNLKHLRIDKD